MGFGLGVQLRKWDGKGTITETRYSYSLLTAGEGVVGAHGFPITDDYVVDVNLPVRSVNWLSVGVVAKLGREDGVDVTRDGRRRRRKVYFVLGAYRAR